jgi:hypothetical protein
MKTFGLSEIPLVDFKAALPLSAVARRRQTSSGTAPISNARMFWFQQFIFFMSDCFTSKRDELRLGQDLTEGNERKVTMKKPKDH